jgi:putative DNA primase/helicase
MTWVNFRDAEAQILAAGILPDKDLVVDGRIQRWKTADSKGNEKPGWTRLREWQSKAGHRYVVGCYGIWSGNHDGYTKIELPKKDDDPQRPALTDEDIAAAKEAQKAAAKAIADERKREAKVAAGWAAQVWAACAPAVEHEYMTRKQIPPSGARVLTDTGGLRLMGIDDGNRWRLDKSVGALVVPMHDTNGNVCGIQFIFPAGHERTGKEFWPTGMAMGGSFGIIGHLRRSGVLLLTEGFATAASLAAATGQAVAYAFSANNLGKAAKEIRTKYKQLRILICADDDYLTEAKQGTNPGVSAAQLAASAIELADWIKPDFIFDGADIRNGKKFTDFNDLHVLTGLTIPLAHQINAKLDALKWKDAQPVAGNGNQGGGGSDDVDEAGRRRAVSVLGLDAVVERFIFIDDDTGDFVFDTWSRSVCKRSKMSALLPAGMRPDDIKRHPLWMSRAVYIDQVGFDPGEDDPNIKCNRWAGWPTVPKAGSCATLLELLRYLCSAEENADELYRWLLCWLAWPLQHPGAKMHSAIVVHGPQGTGKSRFFEAYAKIFGEYSIILNQGAIEDKFNADWSERKLFVLADEIVANTEKYHLKNQLKNFITSDWVRINPKNVAAHRERNHMNMVFLSNEIQPVVLENDDRRHCVIYTPIKMGDEFYAEVTEEIDKGGIAALHQYLLEVDTSAFKPWTRPPMTAAKLRLIEVGAGSEEQFIAEWAGNHLDIPFCPIGRSVLYAEYLKYCKREGDPRPRPSKYFWPSVERRGWFVGIKDRLENLHGSTTRSWRCCVPDDAALEAAALKKGTVDYRMKPGTSQSAWLAECYFSVEAALEKRGQDDRFAA